MQTDRQTNRLTDHLVSYLMNVKAVFEHMSTVSICEQCVMGRPGDGAVSCGSLDSCSALCSSPISSMLRDFVSGMFSLWREETNNLGPEVRRTSK